MHGVHLTFQQLVTQGHTHAHKDAHTKHTHITHQTTQHTDTWTQAYSNINNTCIDYQMHTHTTPHTTHTTHHTDAEHLHKHTQEAKSDKKHTEAVPIDCT